MLQELEQAPQLHLYHPHPHKPHTPQLHPSSPHNSQSQHTSITDVLPPKMAIIAKATEEGWKVREDTLECSPNRREHEPQWLTYIGSDDQAGKLKKPKFNNGDTHRLTHTISGIGEPQAIFEGPHDTPAPANDKTTPSMSEWYPPTTWTSSTAPLSPAKHMFTTPPCQGPQALPTALTLSTLPQFMSYEALPPHGHLKFTCTPSMSAPSTNPDPINMAANLSHIGPAHTLPGDPVAVNPIWWAHGFWPMCGHKFFYHYCFRKVGEVPGCDWDSCIWRGGM